MKDGTVDELIVRKSRENLAEHMSRVAAGASLVVTLRRSLLRGSCPMWRPTRGASGFMKGQIALLDPVGRISSDMAASIAAKLNPPT